MLNPADVELTRALERGEAPSEGLPHAAHLRVAWVYLTECASLDEAIAKMAATLRGFTASVGKADKYSEPTTVFWMRQVAAARAAMPGADLDAILHAYPRLLDKNLTRAAEAAHVTAPGATDSPRDASHRPVPR